MGWNIMTIFGWIGILGTVWFVVDWIIAEIEVRRKKNLERHAADTQARILTSGVMSPNEMRKSQSRQTWAASTYFRELPPGYYVYSPLYTDGPWFISRVHYQVETFVEAMAKQYPDNIYFVVE